MQFVRNCVLWPPQTQAQLKEIGRKYGFTKWRMPKQSREAEWKTMLTVAFKLMSPTVCIIPWLCLQILKCLCHFRWCGAVWNSNETAAIILLRLFTHMLLITQTLKFFSQTRKEENSSSFYGNQTKYIINYF